MQHDDHPEHGLVGLLAAFVAESVLGDPPSWPSPCQFGEVEGLFWNSPLTLLGSGFVDGIKAKGQQAHSTVEDEG